jgi:hypothetical protein
MEHDEKSLLLEKIENWLNNMTFWVQKEGMEKPSIGWDLG